MSAINYNQQLSISELIETINKIKEEQPQEFISTIRNTIINTHIKEKTRQLLVNAIIEYGKLNEYLKMDLTSLNSEVIKLIFNCKTMFEKDDVIMFDSVYNNQHIVINNTSFYKFYKNIIDDGSIKIFKHIITNKLNYVISEDTNDISTYFIMEVCEPQVSFTFVMEILKFLDNSWYDLRNDINLFAQCVFNSGNKEFIMLFNEIYHKLVFNLSIKYDKDINFIIKNTITQAKKYVKHDNITLFQDIITEEFIDSIPEEKKFEVYKELTEATFVYIPHHKTFFLAHLLKSFRNIF